MGNVLQIRLVLGDITELATDAIVNAANEQLAHGGGVAGAISRQGGPAIQAESDAWVQQKGIVPTGSVAITGSGRLKCRYVIHAVGPVMGSGDEDEKLRAATWSAIELAEEKKLHSLAFPAISTGIYGYPVERCARIMISIALQPLKALRSLQLIVFCLFDQATLDTFTSEFERQKLYLKSG